MQFCKKKKMYIYDQVIKVGEKGTGWGGGGAKPKPYYGPPPHHYKETKIQILFVLLRSLPLQLGLETALNLVANNSFSRIVQEDQLYMAVCFYNINKKLRNLI